MRELTNPSDLAAVQAALAQGNGLAASTAAPGSALAAQQRGGPLTNGVWVKYPTTGRLRLKGNGTLTLDTRALDGTVSLAVAGPYTAPDDDGAFPDIDFDTYEVRGTLTDTATAEIV